MMIVDNIIFNILQNKSITRLWHLGLDVPHGNLFVEKTSQLFMKYHNSSKLGFYIQFNSQGHIGTGPKYCHM